MYQIIGGDQREYGPVTAEEIRQWIAEGRLNGQTKVKTGAGPWRPLSTYPEFAESLGLEAASTIAPAGAIPPANASAWGNQIAHRGRDLAIGSCLARSFRLLGANFGVLVGATFMVWLISVVMQFLPLVGIVYWLLRGVLYGGLYLVYLKVIRGEATSVNEVFAGFGAGFSQLMLVGIVSSFLSGVGLLFCILPWVYLTVAWIFSVPLVADKHLEFWSAMELSRKAVSGIWFKVLVLVVLAFLPVILVTAYTDFKIFTAMWSSVRELFTGTAAPDPARITQVMNTAMLDIAKNSLPLVLVTKLVLLLNLPFAAGALMYAYEDLFGPRPAPPA